MKAKAKAEISGSPAACLGQGEFLAPLSAEQPSILAGAVFPFPALVIAPCPSAVFTSLRKIGRVAPCLATKPNTAPG